LPRPSPFTQADIEARSRLTGLPKFAAAKGDVQPEDVFPTEVAFTKVITEADGSKRVRKEIRGRRGITDEMRHVARNWNFSAAIDTLGVMRKDYRDLCQDELILICINNKLARRAEEQETPGRKARAFQLAPRWQKKRKQAQELFRRKARNADKKLTEQALRLWKQTPWLPQSLEQEAVRELGHIPCSRDDFAPLRKQIMQLARRGGYKSWALRNTIHALQACAATWNPKLIWDKNRRAPPKRLLKFLVQVLRAAKINHPNPDESYSRFAALMLRPRKPTKQQTKQSTEQPPSKAERRLAKVYL
jgi:hypothetical protein